MPMKYIKTSLDMFRNFVIFIIKVIIIIKNA